MKGHEKEDERDGKKKVRVRDHEKGFSPFASPLLSSRFLAEVRHTTRGYRLFVYPLVLGLLLYGLRGRGLCVVRVRDLSSREAVASSREAVAFYAFLQDVLIV